MAVPARAERDRDERGRALNARQRDRLGRPLPRGVVGVEPLVEADLQRLAPTASLDLAQRLLDEGFPFQAHEVLEAAWKNAEPDLRPLWQGLAQLAVGLTHAERGNLTGARTLLERGTANLERCRVPIPHGIDRNGLLAWSRALLAALAAEGEEFAPPRLRSGPPEPDRPHDLS